MYLPNMQDYKMWIPVLDNMGYNGKKKKEMCKYCISASHIETQVQMYKDNEISKLPISLKILAAIPTLNNDNVIFTSDSEIKSETYKSIIELKSELKDVLNQEVMSEYIESLITKTVSHEINNKILSVIGNTDYDIAVFNTNNLITKIDTDINFRGKSCMVVLYSFGLSGF